MLEPGDVETRVSDGDVLVAVEPTDPSGADSSRDSARDGSDTGSDVPAERILGAIVLEPLEADAGAHVAGIAVRRRRRDDGVGTALVDAALERAGRLTARFDADVAPFYESLGFSIEPIDEQRCQGTLIDGG